MGRKGGLTAVDGREGGDREGWREEVEDKGGCTRVCVCV